MCNEHRDFESAAVDVFVGEEKEKKEEKKSTIKKIFFNTHPVPFLRVGVIAYNPQSLGPAQK